MLREHEFSGRFLFREDERLIEVIEEFTHHHGRRDLVIVNGRAADVTDEEFFPGRE